MLKNRNPEIYCDTELIRQDENVLPDELACLVSESREFLDLEFRECQQHSWFRRCMALRETRAYLKRKHQSPDGFFAKSLAVAAAKAYSAVSLYGQENRYPTAQKARQIQKKAIGLNGLIAGEVWLPEEAKTVAFHAGLASLQCIYPCRRKAGENNKGDPDRRIFMNRLAGLLFQAFGEMPVRVIVGLTGIWWETTDERMVRSWLTEELKEEITEWECREIGLRDESITQAYLAVNRMSVPVLTVKAAVVPVQDNIRVLVSAVDMIRTIELPELKRDLLTRIRKSCEEHGISVDQNIFI